MTRIALDAEVVPTEIVASGCRLESGIEIGPKRLIEDNWMIGKSLKIAEGVCIAANARIRDRTTIDSGTTIVTGAAVGQKIVIESWGEAKTQRSTDRLELSSGSPFQKRRPFNGCFLAAVSVGGLRYSRYSVGFRAFSAAPACNGAPRRNGSEFRQLVCLQGCNGRYGQGRV